MAEAERPQRSGLLDPVVLDDYRLRRVPELLSFRPATFLCGASKPGVHVDGADPRSAPGADPTTRPFNRAVQYLQQRAQGFQRRDRRCCRRTHWRALVIGAQLDDPIGRDRCAICVRDSRAGKRRGELNLGRAARSDRFSENSVANYIAA